MSTSRPRTRPSAGAARGTDAHQCRESLLEQLLHRDVLDVGLDELPAAGDVPGLVVERSRVGLGVQHDAVGAARAGLGVGRRSSAAAMP